MRKDIDEYYRALGLNPGAGPVEIKRAYRQMVRRWHPDLFKPGSPMQTTAEDITKEINEAYDHLYRKKLYRKYLSKADRSAERDAEKDEPEEKAPARASKPDSRPKEKAAGRWWRRREKVPGSQGLAARMGHVLHRHRRRILLSVGACAALGAGFAAVRGLTDTPFAQPSPALPAVQAGAHRASGVAAEPKEPMTAPSPAPEQPRTEETASLPTASGAVPEIRALGGTAIDGQSNLGRIGDTLLPELQGGREMEGTPPRGAVPSPGAAPVPSAHAAPAVSEQALADTRRWEAVIGRAEELLLAFDYGDTKARVREVQGPPDEEGEGVYRYGSSVVYFRNGFVSGWIDRFPQLRIHKLPALEAVPLDWFHLGSSRSDVVRAQGLPDSFTLASYSFGTSTVSFDRDEVSAFSEGDVSLRAMSFPVLPFDASAR